MSDIERSCELHELLGRIHSMETVIKLAKKEIEKCTDEIAVLCNNDEVSK